jgi:nucleoid DNA-binding protein
MSKLRWPARAALLSCLGLFLCLTAPAQTVKVGANPKIKEAPKQATLEGRIAAMSKVSEEDVAKVLRALGPAVTERLTNGATVEIPNLGVFRVVRVEEHKDLVYGRPATIAARQYVEYLPAGGLNDAASSDKAVPAASVPPFEYVLIGNEVPRTRVENTRVPGTRTR